MRGLVILLSLVVCMIQPGTATAVTRSASTPPTAPVVDLHFDDTIEMQLNWTYCVNGDYDQNGETNISDLTPLGHHLGKTSASPDWEAARVADGDNNGEVNIADVTPIGQSLGRRVDNFLVLTSPSDTGPFVSLPTQVNYDSAPQGAGGGPRLFSFELTNPIADNYYAVIARDGQEDAEQYSNVVQYIPGNIPPEAVLSAPATLEGPPGLWLIFNAADSSDPDGTIVEYEWDLLGNGEFESTGLGNVNSHIYTAAGVFEPVLRVTDDGGASSTVTGDPVTITLDVIRTDTLDSSLIAGLNCVATTTVDGVPCAAYLISDAGIDLKFVRAQTAAAEFWLAPAMIDQDAEVDYLSLGKKADDGLVLSCKDGLGDLGIFNGASDGSTWGLIAHPRAQDTAQYGYNTDIMPYGEYNAIAYADDEQRIWFTFPNSGYWHIRVSPLGTMGERPAVVRLGNRPTMVYSNLTGGSDVELYFVRAEGQWGDIWAEPVALISGGTIGTNQYSLLELTSEQGLVVFNDYENDTLMALGTTDFTNIAWTEPMVVDAAAAVDDRYCLAEVNRFPCIAYTDTVTNELRLVYARDFDGHTWNDPVVIASNGAGYQYIALIDHADYPLVFYQDRDDNNLKAAVFH